MLNAFRQFRSLSLYALFSVSAGVGLLNPACAQSVGDYPNWDSLLNTFLEEHLQAHPLGATFAGRHEFDGLFPDWSRDGIAAEIERIREWQARVTAFSAHDLGPVEQFQREHLLAVLRANAFWLDSAESPFRNPAFYFERGDSLDPSGYVTRNSAPAADRLAGLTRYLDNLPSAVDHISENLSGELSVPHIDYGVIRFGGLAGYIRDDLVPAFTSVTDSALQERFAAARNAAASALDRLVEQLESQRGSATGNFALGPDLYLEMLRETELVNLSLEELNQIAAEDLERNLSALESVCQAYVSNAALSECMDRMGDNKPEGNPIVSARGLLSELRAYIVENRLLTLPLDDSVRIEEAPAFARTNLAYLMPTGPFEAVQDAIFYLAGPDPSWSPEVQHDFIPGRGYLVSLTAHETLPGHFAHVLHTRASELATFQQMFFSVLFVEGWAHYAEELLVETGMRPNDLEFQLGVLSWELQRNVRFICSLGMHTQGMTVEECESKFRNEAFQDAGTARQQAVRGTYDPMYLSYTLGKLMIRRARDEWALEHGGRESWQQFHDAFLSYGMPPIPLIEAELFDQSLRE